MTAPSGQWLRGPVAASPSGRSSAYSVFDSGRTGYRCAPYVINRDGTSLRRQPLPTGVSSPTSRLSESIGSTSATTM